MEGKEFIRQRLQELRRWDNEAVQPCINTAEYIQETLDKWSPLAEQLGMHPEQTELNNLCVKLGYPEDYRRLKRLLMESELSCEMVFKTFALPIRALLDELGIEYEFKYRMKSVYSIWRKMRVDHKEFDDVYDLFATRIIYKPLPTERFNVNTPLDEDPEIHRIKQQTYSELDAERLTCWKIYTIINMLYRTQHDRIKNWINHPKPSGYQALQMTVMGPDCNWIEIQVRSERMDYEAEYGSAAHWRYKQESSTH